MRRRLEIPDNVLVAADRQEVARAQDAIPRLVQAGTVRVWYDDQRYVTVVEWEGAMPEDLAPALAALERGA